MAARKPDDGLVRVTVAGNYQVSHEGHVYGPGESVRVPAEVAEKWKSAGYAD